jgi:hypothetical protein
MDGNGAEVEPVRMAERLLIAFQGAIPSACFRRLDCTTERGDIKASRLCTRGPMSASLTMNSIERRHKNTPCSYVQVLYTVNGKMLDD